MTDDNMIARGKSKVKRAGVSAALKASSTRSGIARWFKARTPLQIAATALLGIVAAVVTLAAIPDARTRIEWGTAPAWMTVAGGAFAVIGVAISYQSLQVSVKHRLDDEMSQARLLLHRATSWYDETPSGPLPQVVITSRNAGTEPLHHVRVVGVTCNGIACTQTFQEQIKSTRDRPMTLQYNETQESIWILPTGTDPIGGNDLAVGHTYFDGAGRRWERLRDHDPVRIYNSTATRADHDKFAAALRTRDDEQED